MSQFDQEKPNQAEFKIPRHLERDRIQLSDAKIREAAAEVRNLPDYASGHEIIESFVRMEAVSLRSEKRRKENQPNQDSYFSYVHPDQKFFAAGVFDGLGGPGHGAEVSAHFRDSILAELKALEAKQELRIDDLLAAIKAGAYRAGAYYNGLSKKDESYDRSDTTMCLVVGFPNAESGNYTVLSINSGDSAAYKRTGDGVSALTAGESLMDELYENGRITELQKKIHWRRNVMNHTLRSPRKHPNESSPNELIKNFPYAITVTALEAGDSVVLCTDGLDKQFRQDHNLNEVDGLIDSDYTATDLVGASYARRRQKVKDLSQDDDTTVIKIDLLPVNPAETVLTGRPEVVETEADPNEPTQEIPDYIQMIKEISHNKIFASYVGAFLQHKSSYEEALDMHALAELFSQYPTADALKANAPIRPFLEGIRQGAENASPGSGAAALEEYENSLQPLLDVLYPELNK